MNILKLQDMLKGVPDKALINYVQNPTGEVPSYLALSELKRRQDVRDTYQKEQAPQSSVAEDLTQAPDQSGLAMLAKNPTPQGAPTSQGVADLPTGDMYQEQNFASGGIIAFADGGEAEQEYYDRFKSDVGGISELAGYKHKFLNPDKYKYKPVKRFAAGDYVAPSMSPQEYYKKLQEELAASEANQGFFKNPIKSIRSEQTLRAAQSPYDEAIKYYQGLGQANAVQELQMQKYKWLRSKEDPTATMTETGMKGIGSPVAKPITLKDLENKISTNNPPLEEAPKEVRRGATGRDEEEPPMAPDVDVKGDMFAFDARPEDVANTERERYKQMYGTDPFIGRAQTRLEAMDKRAKSMEDQNLGLALMTAGFKTMQGTSPYALANIGAGAEAGVKAYGETEKQLMDLEEKRFNVDAKIAEAQRAVETAAINHGFKSEEYNKAANDLKNTEILKGKLDIEKYKVLAGTNETKMVMGQKQNFEKDRAKFLQDNWNIKHSVDVYNNKNAFDKLSEIEKRAVLRDVETYNLKINKLIQAYPLANTAVPSRDPNELLRLTRS